MKVRQALFASCYAGLTFGLAQGALAQTSGGSPTTVNPSANTSPTSGGVGVGGGLPTTMLGEVVVTAQKRSENIQKAPLEIVALSAEDVSRAGVRDFSDMQKVAPAVRVEDVQGATDIAIRGVRQSALGPTNDTPTAVHLDGIYLARPTGIQGFFYDIQRIEVLEGPQGTLYGRNATGGVVNVITNKPTNTFGGALTVEGGNYGLYRTEGALNVPVTDALALRGAFHFYGHDGFLKPGFDNANEKGGRLEALWKITPKAKLLITGDYELSITHGGGLSVLGVTYPSPIPGPPGGPAPMQQAIPNTPIPSDPLNGSSVEAPYGLLRNYQRSEVYGFSGQFDYDLDVATLTAQLGYRRVGNLGYGSNDGSTAVPPPIDSVGYTDTPSRSVTKSAEVRLTSNATTPLQWVIGGFYFTEDNSGDFCAVPSLLLAPGSVCGIDINNPRNHTSSYAIFGQTTYTPDILDSHLHLVLGLRYNSDDKSADTRFSLFTPNGPVVLSNLSFTGVKASYSHSTYKIGFSYDITPRNLFYFNVSTGFRAGGFAYGSTPQYKPETIKAYEAGIKNRFLDNRLQINADIYHYDYNGQEVNVFAPSMDPHLPFSDLTVKSIGAVAYTGGSVSIDYAITPNDRIDTDVEYLNARYVRFVIPPGFAVSPPLNLLGLPNGQAAGDYSGSQVYGAPHWTGNFSYDHSWTMLSGKFDARVSVQYATERNFGLYAPGTLQYAATEAQAYARTDVSVRYAPNAQAWTVTAYVNNLTDERTPLSKFYENDNNNAQPSGLITGNLLPPLTFGAIFGIKF